MIYAVALAPYDPIVQLNQSTSAPAATLLPGSNVVNVYVDSDTALLNTAAPGVGGTFRFNGLLFNDKGVLRMVCDQVNDGVSPSSRENRSLSTTLTRISCGG